MVPTPFNTFVEFPLCGVPMASFGDRQRSPRGRARSSPPRVEPVDQGARTAVVGLEGRIGALEVALQGLQSTLQQQQQTLQPALAALPTFEGKMTTMETNVATVISAIEAKLRQMEAAFGQLSQTVAQAAVAGVATPSSTPQPVGSAPPSPPGVGVTQEQDDHHRPQGFSQYSQRKIIHTPKSDLTEPLPTYCGTSKSDGDLWYKKVRNHLISQHQELKQFLDWAEGHGAARISMAKVQDYSAMSDLEPCSLANELWGFLNSNLKGDAHNGFLGVEESNGAEAWRKVVHGINGRTPIRRLALKRLVDAPPEAQHMGEVMPLVERWEESVRMYVRAGGRQPEDEERRATLLSIVPASEQVFLIRQQFADYDEMREHIRGQTELLEHLGLQRKKPAHLHSFNEYPPPPSYPQYPTPSSYSQPPTMQDQYAHDLSESGQGDLMAITKGKSKGKGRINPAVICYGCGQQGHPQRLCPYRTGGSYGKAVGKGGDGGKSGFKGGTKGQGKGPAINPNVQCFNCGQKGHPQRLCPQLHGGGGKGGKGGKGGAHALLDHEGGWVDEAVQDTPITLNAATVGSESWSAPRRPVKPQSNSTPIRRPFTIQDFISANRFGSVEEDDEAMPTCAFYDTGAQDLHAVQSQHKSQPQTQPKHKPPKNIRAPRIKKTSFRPMLDSGAGEFVCSSRHAPSIPVKPSAGSLKGQTFGTAGKDVLRNQGQQQFTMATHDGGRLNCTWQTADVSRPLMGVGRVCDTDNRGAFFTKEGAVILDRATTAAIKGYIEEHGVSLCRFEREGGVYVLEAEIDEEEGGEEVIGGESEQVFVRPGQ